MIGGFLFSDNTCPNCRAGIQSACRHGGGYDGCQSELIRVPLADGTLVATPDEPPKDLVPSLLALSDVMSTGWYAAVCAGVAPGMTVAVVGDGAVGLSGVLAASQLGAERVIAMSRHRPRQSSPARSAPPTGDRARRRGHRPGQGAHRGGRRGRRPGVRGHRESMLQALRSTRPGGLVGFVGVPHGVELPVHEMFFSNVGLRGGPAPVRRYLPDLMDRVWNRRIEPGPGLRHGAAAGTGRRRYRAMDERRAIKVLLRP